MAVETKIRLRQTVFDDVAQFGPFVWDEISNILGSPYYQSPICAIECIRVRYLFLFREEWEIGSSYLLQGLRTLSFIRPELVDSPALHRAARIDLMRSRYHTQGRIDLIELLAMARSFQFDHPRELIRAMAPLSLPLTPRVPRLYLDDTMSAQQMFIRAARHIVIDHQDLSIWRGERPPCTKLVPDLPSWVPDFSASATSSILPTHTGLLSWSLAMQQWKDIQVSDENYLIVQAGYLDQIKYISPIFCSRNAANLCVELRDDLHRFVAPSLIPMIMEHFWRTLVSNHQTLGTFEAIQTQPSPGMSASFYHFISEMRELLRARIHAPGMLERERQDADPQSVPDTIMRVHEFSALLRTNAFGRRFFVTESGRFGMTTIEDPSCVDGAREAQPPDLMNLLRRGAVVGDIIVACLGSATPCILRRKNKTYHVSKLGLEQSFDMFELIGECYLHGAMDGEDFKAGEYSSDENMFQPDPSRVKTVVIE
jgi:hypothetical protein